MASKYLIKFRGRHVFNPSNFALVLAFLILGSSRADPLQFWWGPLSPALLIVLLVIVGGALLVLPRVGLLAVAAHLLVHVRDVARDPGAERPCVHGELAPRSGGGLLLLEGAGPLAGGLHLPVVHDHRPADGTGDPAGPARSTRSRIGLLSALLIAPMETEFWAKVALLRSLTIVCAARPVLILAREALERRRAPSARLGRALATAAAPSSASLPSPVAAFTALLVAAGSPARSSRRSRTARSRATLRVTIEHTPSVVSISPQMGRQIAADAVANLRLVSVALGSRPCARGAATGHTSRIKRRSRRPRAARSSSRATVSSGRPAPAPGRRPGRRRPSSPR